jgi:hypothetical protein
VPLPRLLFLPHVKVRTVQIEVIFHQPMQKRIFRGLLRVGIQNVRRWALLGLPPKKSGNEKFKGSYSRDWIWSFIRDCKMLNWKVYSNFSRLSNCSRSFRFSRGREHSNITSSCVFLSFSVDLIRRCLVISSSLSLRNFCFSSLDP